MNALTGEALVDPELLAADRPLRRARIARGAYHADDQCEGSFKLAPTVVIACALPSSRPSTIRGLDPLIAIRERILTRKSLGVCARISREKCSTATIVRSTESRWVNRGLRQATARPTRAGGHLSGRVCVRRAARHCQQGGPPCSALVRRIPMKDQVLG